MLFLFNLPFSKQLWYPLGSCFLFAWIILGHFNILGCKFEKKIEVCQCASLGSQTLLCASYVLPPAIQAQNRKTLTKIVAFLLSILKSRPDPATAQETGPGPRLKAHNNSSLQKLGQILTL